MTWDVDPHCNSRCTMHLLMNHSWKCASSENQTLLNDTSLFWSHSANVILWCLFLTLNVDNTVILYGYKFKSFLNIFCTDYLDIPSCAAAFVVDLLGLLCSAALTASVFSRERRDEGRRRFLSNTEPSLLNWLENLWNVLNEGTNRVWKRARNRLCLTTTLLVSVKNNIFLWVVLQRVFLVIHLV
jgi:hypothetical protein